MLEQKKKWIWETRSMVLNPWCEDSKAYSVMLKAHYRKVETLSTDSPQCTLVSLRIPFLGSQRPRRSCKSKCSPCWWEILPGRKAGFCHPRLTEPVPNRKFLKHLPSLSVGSQITHPYVNTSFSPSLFPLFLSIPSMKDVMKTTHSQIKRALKKNSFKVTHVRYRHTGIFYNPLCSAVLSLFSSHGWWKTSMKYKKTGPTMRVARFWSWLCHKPFMRPDISGPQFSYVKYCISWYLSFSFWN